jgi:hypothetical protein
MRGGAVSLRALGLVSALYDLALALPMLLAPTAVARMCGAPEPVPVVNAQINGVFALALAAGYLWAAREPGARRGYFWVAGVLAKGLGAIVFLADHWLRGSPGSFLLFAGADGTLALLTLVVLMRTPVSTGRTRYAAAAPRR